MIHQKSNKNNPKPIISSNMYDVMDLKCDDTQTLEKILESETESEPSKKDKTDNNKNQDQSQNQKNKDSNTYDKDIEIGNTPPNEIMMADEKTPNK
ncbi:hypothetical protein BB561_006340 [Smittium simulii]|uniref:Uncharacterized protein n=1 Tax=Smittium simulii TaxID=133385 RepID=A0A2T9Y529_9FUNG|nr:hypothetical protein BB561_006340 [Smittium simulii]